MNKILIIDDDGRLVKNVQTYLKDFDYRIEYALNGVEGLQKVKEFKPDLVILDLMVPALDGLEVLKEIRKDNPVPIIISPRGGRSLIKWPAWKWGRMISHQAVQPPRAGGTGQGAAAQNVAAGRPPFSEGKTAGAGRPDH